MQLLGKLHKNYMSSKDAKAAKDPSGKDTSDQNDFNNKGRKANFFERKRFLNYEKTSDSDDEKDGKKDDGKKDAGVTKQIKDGNIV